MSERRQVEISTSIIFRVGLVILSLWFLYLVRDVIALLFISILIVSALSPLVNWLQRKKISRNIAVLLIYVFILLLISLSFFFVIPPLLGQLNGFFSQFGENLQKIAEYTRGVEESFQAQNIHLNISQIIEQSGNELLSFSPKIFSLSVGVFSGIVSFIIVLVMAFYMLMREDGIKHFIISVTPEKHKEYASDLIAKINATTGKWMQGQVTLMVIIFLLDLIVLSTLGIPYALALAFFAGIMEIIPYIGPIVSAIPAVVIGFVISPIKGFLVLALYIAIQQFENHVVTPQVMKKTLGIHPITVIIAILVGIKLGGVLGAILGVPIVAALSVVFKDFIDRTK